MEPFVLLAYSRERHRHVLLVTELWRQQMRQIEQQAVQCFYQQDLSSIAMLLDKKRILQKRLCRVEDLLRVWGL